MRKKKQEKRQIHAHTHNISTEMMYCTEEKNGVVYAYNEKREREREKNVAEKEKNLAQTGSLNNDDRIKASSNNFA